MKLLRQLAIILLIAYVGELVHTVFNLPIPGNVLGMLLLFIGLSTGIVKIKMIDTISNFLLEHLSFFFVPAGVGILACFPLLKDNWISFILVCILTTILIIVITGWTIQLYIKRSDQND